MSPAPSSRLLNLDSLRAVAALSVGAHHAFGGAFLPFLDGGRFGVLLFFLISGYCIVLSLDSLTTRPLLEFLARRLVRLYPSYWLAVIAAALLLPQAVPVGQFLANLTMVQTLFGVSDLSGVFWTLFIEILFYGLVALLLAMGKARDLKVLVAACAGLALAALAAALLRRFAGLAAPFAHLLFLSAFLFGGAMCRAEQEGGHGQRVWIGAAAYLAVILAIAHLVFGDAAIGNETRLRFFGNYALAVLLFVAVLRLNWLRWRPLARIGTVSYGIYLFHGPVHDILQRAGLDMQPGPGALVSLAMAVAVSAAVYRWVETPCIAWGRRWVQRPASMRR